MTSETLSAKQVLWRERLLAWQQSGLSTAQWCRQQQLPEHQFFYWKRKLKPGTEHKLIPVVVPPEEAPTLSNQAGNNRTPINFQLEKVGVLFCASPESAPDNSFETVSQKGYSLLKINRYS